MFDHGKRLDIACLKLAQRLRDIGFSTIVLLVFLLLYFFYLWYLCSLYRVPRYGDITGYISDATNLARGQPYRDTYRGFGYSLLLSLPYRFDSNVDLFAVSKHINCFSTVVALVFFYLLFAKVSNKKIALLTVLLVATTKFFFDIAIVQSATDMFFVALCAISIYLCLDISSWPRMMVAGLCAGYAFITRYNGAFLVGGYLTWLVLLFVGRWKSGSRPLPLARSLLQFDVVPYCAAYAIAAFPWLLYNHRLHGNPLYNRNYLNMAYAIYGGGDWYAFWCCPKEFDSFLDVILRDPLRFVRFWPVNAARGVAKSLGMTFQPSYIRLGILLGSLSYCWHMTRRRLLPLLSLFVYLVIVGLAFYNFRFYTFAVPFYAFFLVFLLARVLHRVRFSLHGVEIPWAVLLVLALAFRRGAVSFPRAQRVADRYDDSLVNAAQYVKNNYSEQTVITMDPVLAFLSTRRHIWPGCLEDEVALLRYLAQLPRPALLYYNESLGLLKWPQCDSLLDGTKRREYLEPLLVLSAPRAVLYEVLPFSVKRAGEVADGQALGQSFVAKENNLNRIDVLMSTYRRANSEPVTFRLASSPLTNHPDRRVTVSASEIVENSFYPFRFPPVPSSKGKRFFFSLESPSSTGGNAVTACFFTINCYAFGERYQNAKPVTGDLVFRTQYGEGYDGLVALLRNLDNQVMLIGYTLNKTCLNPGGELKLALYWQAIERMNRDYTIFTHLLGTDNQIWGQKDSQPLGGKWPTTHWRQGEIVEDTYRIPVNAKAPPGVYQLEVGMHDWRTGERLPVFSESGGRVPYDRILLQDIHVLAQSKR